MTGRSFTYRYRPTRPVRFEDMGDYRWKYLEAPPALADNMGGVPISKHEFGIIITDRFVLPSHLEKTGLEQI